MVKEKIDVLMQQEITRRDFLKSAGIIAITLIGLPAIINSITKAFNHNTHKKQVNGYGHNPYGG